MNNKPGWLVVILISSIQLAFLLVAVMILFSWFLDRTEETVGRQACSENRALMHQIVNSIEKSKIHDIRTDPSHFKKLRESLAQFRVPNGGFACFIQADCGESICHDPSQPVSRTSNFENAVLQPLAKSSNLNIRLLDSFSQQPNLQHVDGRISFDGREHFVNGQYLPELDAILLIGQPIQKSMAGISDIITYAKRWSFALTLLVGLVGMCLIATILNRASTRVESLNQGLEREVSQRELELVKTQNAVIFGLAKLAESRDNDTGQHLERIRSYVTILATDLAARNPDLDEEWVRILGLASSLHDIGKVGIPDSILLKPGQLTKEEREVMELHTLIGGECLQAIQSRLGRNVFMDTARQIAFHHHERWDGTGYPHGLSENEIPLVARIVAVADVYDALTSKRPYKQPMGHLESKSIILSGSGSQFDPEVVDAFVRHEESFKAISCTQTLLSDDDVRTEFHVLCERAKASEEIHPTA